MARPLITYEQKTGHISLNGKRVGKGYSGYGIAANDPNLEHQRKIGPIPRGHWKIDRWQDTYPGRGPIVAVLSPVGHDAHGRSGFLIHGDNSTPAPFDGSHGCIVLNRIIRQQLRDSGDMELEVI